MLNSLTSLCIFGQLPYFQTSSLLLLIVSLSILGFWVLPRWVAFFTEHWFSSQITSSYQRLFEPSFPLLRIGFGLIIADVLLLLIQPIMSLSLLESFLSLSIVGLLCYLGIQIINRFYHQNIRDSVGAGRKLDIEFFIVSKNLVILALIISIVAIFDATHNIDIFALLASIGIGGVAVAFSAQKVLEQFIGGIVLYFDSPFAIDDYIKLPDGTFGRVESIGLRLTKIRTSGKGTLVSVPNNLLVEENIENFTSAGRVIAIINLRFPQGIDLEEQALIRQILIAGFQDVAGIDPRSTAVSFSEEFSGAMSCQVSFCVFNAANESSRDVRREVIKAAANKVNQKLQDFGMLYEAEVLTNAVHLPIAI